MYCMLNLIQEMFKGAGLLLREGQILFCILWGSGVGRWGMLDVACEVLGCARR